jgi:hypothetical protein
MTIVKMGNCMIHGNGFPGYEVNESREELVSYQEPLHTCAWYIDRMRGKTIIVEYICASAPKKYLYLGDGCHCVTLL